MGSPTSGDAVVDELLVAPTSRVLFVDVPEHRFVVVDGVGDPQDAAFGDALQALYAVSYGV